MSWICSSTIKSGGIVVPVTSMGKICGGRSPGTGDRTTMDMNSSSRVPPMDAASNSIEKSTIGLIANPITP